VKQKVLRRQRDKAREDAELSWGCLDMIRETLIGHGMSMDACPPMFYPEAIHNLCVKILRSSHLKNGHAGDLAKCAICLVILKEKEAPSDHA